MRPASFVPLTRSLGGLLHALVAVLLVVVVVRAASDDGGVPALVVAVLFGVGYAAPGPIATLRADLTRSRWWFAVVVVVWAVLALLTADAVWLAFPLFFLAMYLYPGVWGPVVVTAMTVVAVASFAGHHDELDAGAVIGPVIGALVAIVLVRGFQALARESEDRQRLLEELRAAQQQLATSERRAGVAGERERLAREIHDTLAQGFSSITLLLTAASRALPDRPEAADAHVRDARDQASRSLAEARRFVRDLTPPDLGGRSLDEALRRVCAGQPQPVEYRVSGTPHPVPVHHETALLRVTQEALANAVRHAHADRIEVELVFTPDATGVRISDDGQGFAAVPADDADAGGGYGLIGMRRRMDAAGGTLAVDSASDPGAGRGTIVSASVAWAEEREGEED